MVTGGAGFVGTNLIKRLLTDGHEVISIDNYSIGTKKNHIDGCTYYDIDITSPKGLDWFGDSYDVVYHLAGLSRIQPSFEDPIETFNVNTLGCIRIAEWARKTKTKVVYAGSSSRWHDPFQSPYATTKHLGEEIFKMYKKSYNLNVEIARFYNVYGPHEIIDGDWAAVIGIWRRQIRDGLPITIVGNGNQRRDFTHVDDIVDALCKIAFTNESHDDAWELGSGKNYSINEVADMFEKYATNVKRKYISDQPGNYRRTIRESDSALDRLDWQPSDKLNEYIKELYV